MNVALWIVSGILIVAYLGAGGMKLALPKKKLAENPNLAFAADMSDGSIKSIGGLEVLGAIGLILPWLTGIAMVLTPLAGVGLAVVQLGAFVFHGRRKEFKQWPANILLFVLAAFAAYGRFGQLS